MEQGHGPVPDRMDGGARKPADTGDVRDVRYLTRRPYRPEQRDRFDSIQYWYWEHRFFESIP